MTQATLTRLKRLLLCGVFACWAGGAVGQVSNGYADLMQAALVQSEQGQFKAAARLAGQAFRASDDRVQKLQAARLAAGARLQARQFTQSEWWLRRAANYAGSVEEANRVKQDFQSVRAQNPLSAQLSFSIGPSDNINGGATDRFFYLDQIKLELPASALALSGVEVSGSADIKYVVAQGPRHRTSVGAYLYGRTFALSGASKSAVPDALGSDYALTQLDLSVSHLRFLFEGQGPSGVSFHTGQTWYGGSGLWRYNRLAVSQELKAGDVSTVTLRGFVEGQRAIAAGQPDSTVYGAQAVYARRMGNLDVLRFALDSRFQDADIATYTHWAHRLTVQYDLAQPVLGTSLSLAATVGHKNYDEFSLSLDGRRDWSVSVGATAVFNQISYYGFSPSLTVSASRTESNVSRFSTEGVRASFGFTSTF